MEDSTKNKKSRKERPKIYYVLKYLGLIPKPTEANMFVMALTTIGLLLTSDVIWSEMSFLISIDERGKLGLPFLCILIGIFLSIYHAFSTRKKNRWENSILRSFTIIILTFVSISTAVFVYNVRQPGYLTFTFWNSFQAFTLIFIDHQYVRLSARHVTYLEVGVGVATVVSLLYLNDLANTHWSITFSSVLIAWSIIERYIPRKRRRRS